MVRENLTELQLTDIELGQIIQIHWISTEQRQVAITCTTDDEYVENRPSPQTEVQKDDEVVTETATPPNDSDVAYTVDEAPFRTRPHRTSRPPKYLKDYKCSNNRLGMIRVRPVMRIVHQPNTSTESM